MPAGRDDSPAAPPSSSKPEAGGASTASLLGAAALVGAAAGYAALALRFRTFNASNVHAASAEMRAARAFTREWARNVERDGAGSAGAGAGARTGQAESGGSASGEGQSQWQWQQDAQGQQRQQQQQEQARVRVGESSSGPPTWALRELGLRVPDSDARPFDLDEAKAAYRTKARAVHPDAAGGDGAAFKRLTQAWEAVQASTGGKV